MAKKTSKQSVKLGVSTIYQKEVDGYFFFRYQLNEHRKAVSLKTKNLEEAKKAVDELVTITKVTSEEVIAAHVMQARSLVKPEKNILLANAWPEYNNHPDRARPTTVHEQECYKSSFLELINFIATPNIHLKDVTPKVAENFSDHLREQGIAVDTHNRKLRRIRKVFETLKEYLNGEPNPFDLKKLQRRKREEQEQSARRLSFSRQQEDMLLTVLDDPSKKVLNKPEIKVIYYLGMFTGQRLKDCVLLRWSKVDMKLRRIWVKQFKTGKEVTIPIADKLFPILEQARNWQVDDYVCPALAQRYKRVDGAGKNIGMNLVNKDVLRIIRWIGLEPSIEVEGRKRKVTVYGFHSLRHTFATLCRSWRAQGRTALYSGYRLRYSRQVLYPHRRRSTVESNSSCKWHTRSLSAVPHCKGSRISCNAA